MEKRFRLRSLVICSAVVSVCVLGIAFLVTTIFIARSREVYIHPKIETVFLGHDAELINEFDLRRGVFFNFRPSHRKRRELALKLGIDDSLGDDELLCCAVGHVIVEAYYQWPPEGGATGSIGRAVLIKINYDDKFLHIIRLPWPNGFIKETWDWNISSAEAEDLLKRLQLMPDSLEKD